MIQKHPKPNWPKESCSPAAACSRVEGNLQGQVFRTKVQSHWWRKRELYCKMCGFVRCSTWHSKPGLAIHPECVRSCHLVFESWSRKLTNHRWHPVETGDTHENPMNRLELLYYSTRDGPSYPWEAEKLSDPPWQICQIYQSSWGKDGFPYEPSNGFERQIWTISRI